MRPIASRLAVLTLPLSLALTLHTARAAEAPAPQDSRISAVTIFEDRALVTRTLAVQVPAGRTVVTLGGFPAGLDERSLRAGLDQAFARVEGIRSWTTRTAAQTDPRARDLEGSLEELGDRLAGRSEALAALDVERRYLDAYRAFARAACSENTTSPSPQTGDWARTLTFLQERTEALEARGVTLERERRDLQSQQADLQRQLQEILAPRDRETRTVEVTVESDQAGALTLRCDYQIAGAAWSPVYDARFDPARKEIDFRYYGAIRQQTGEDWKEVTVTLSTSRPASGAARPLLPALQLTGRVRKPEEEKNLMFALRDREDAPAACEAPGSRIGSDSLAVIHDQGPSVTFEIRNLATVPSDGREARVAIATATLTPDLAYEATPKLKPYVYLKATQPNATGLPLLAGPVHISRASGYVGTADLAFTAPGDVLKLSLGVDEAVKVRRRVVRESDEEKQGLRNRRTMTRVYDVEVENYTGDPQTVNLIDQIPVSGLEDVQVELEKSTTPTTSRDPDGILTWTLKLAPGEKRTVHLEFRVTMPQNYRLP